MSDPREPDDQEPDDQELPPDEGDELEPVLDEGLEGDEPAAEGETLEAEPDGEPAPRRRKKSASETIRELRDRAHKAELAAAEARGASAAQANRPDPAAEARRIAEEAEEARLIEQMAPADRAQYLLAKESRAQGQRLQRMEAQLRDSTDAAEFFSKYGTDPRYADYMDEVKTIHAQMLQAGYPLQRLAILQNVIGRRAMSAPAKKNATVARRAAGERVAAARGGNTAPARSNQSGRGSRGGSLVQRMEQADVSI